MERYVSIVIEFVCWQFNFCFLAISQITVYLGKRDFVDHLTHVDPIGNLICFVFIILAITNNLFLQVSNLALFENN